jgi:putative transposase
MLGCRKIRLQVSEQDNEWGLYTFVQMLTYKCALAGKALEYVDEHDSSKGCSRCGHKKSMPLYMRIYRCQNCGLVMDRDENSAVNHYQRFFARLGPYTGDPVRCAAVFTATDNV